MSGGVGVVRTERKAGAADAARIEDTGGAMRAGGATDAARAPWSVCANL